MNIRISTLSVFTILVLSTLAATMLVAAPLGTAFTYQGQLKQAGAPDKLVSLEEDAEVAEPRVRLTRMVRIVEGLVSEKEREKP